MEDSVRVVVLMDHPVLSDALALGLTSDAVEAFPLPAAMPVEVLMRAIERFDPGVVVLGVSHQAVHLAVQMLTALSSRMTKTLLLGAFEDRRCLAECVEAGVSGLVDMSVSLEELRSRVVAAARGEGLLPWPTRHELLADLRQVRAAERESLRLFDRLTPREQEILTSLTDGRPADDIAASEAVSVTTVRTQIRSILRKLQVGSQLEAVALAYRSGWCGASGAPARRPALVRATA